jgi:hypothetical protein
MSATLEKTPVLLAFHGDYAVKEEYLRRVCAHRAADQIVKGRYWHSGKGCAVGCTIHSNEHGAYEKELGIPETLAHLEDTIFENLTNELAVAWPERFLAAPRVGADLSLVWPRFAVWLLTDPDQGVIRFAGSRANVRKSIETVSVLWQRVIDGETVGSLRAEFCAAAAAADVAADAVAAAADAAAAAAVAAAADAAADAAAAAVAADAAADAAAAAAAVAVAAVAVAAAADAAAAAAVAVAAAAVAEYDAPWVRMSDKLIELMDAA